MASPLVEEYLPGGSKGQQRRPRSDMRWPLGPAADAPDATAPAALAAPRHPAGGRNSEGGREG